MEDIIILIPSYKPNKEIMTEFMQELTKKFKNIVVVNDGSGVEFDDFFKSLENFNLKILKHDVNRGKGRAIKTGFDYILKNEHNFFGTITVDCDGQHTVEDIVKCANELKKYPNNLIVGCRDFSEKQIPLRSRFGNKLTRAIFKAFIGLSITDTQSGLRAFGPKIMAQFLKTEGERYEYETNMLIDCKTYDINISEVKIKTVYINKNETSHFNPIVDSLRVYKLFGKYILAAVSSFAVDMILYMLFFNILPIEDRDSKIMIATILARILSSIYNFAVNSKMVFRKFSKSSMVKYLILAIIQMFMSGKCVTLIAKYIHINTTLVKIPVDTVIFIVNFIIQREWVFKNKK